MNKYDPKQIEPKWQKRWEDEKLFAVKDFDKKPKFYSLIEFPYPSGEGLHIGHPLSNTAIDVISRKRRMEGFNVLYPIGWDAFGLPAENYAIKTKTNPKDAVAKNIKIYERQLKMLGFSFDWDRVVNTTDPKYYKWTQWIFLKLFEKGLAYQKKMPVNWCLSCKIGLANEEIVDGKCERCGSEVEKRELKQWMLKITEYADRLIDDLDKVDYLEKIKIQQKNWIGRSKGVNIKFKIADSRQPTADSQLEFSSFTTRIDTIFGVTYVVLAPEHELVEKIATPKQKKEVENYIKKARAKSDLERKELEKEKTGIFTGAYAINPLNNERIPIWIADYVIASYGSGTVMAVPAHDKRDFKFAKKYNLPIRSVIKPSKSKEDPEIFTGEGTLFDSGEFSGEASTEARENIAKWLKKNDAGGKTTEYSLRDWIFSRQHYWGDPIPIIHCKNCGAVPVPEKELPVKLPYVKEYEPTETGESPLAKVTDWVNVKCPKCGENAKRETDTMPTWAGSSWYFLRYCDPFNDKELANKEKLKYWMPVDWYNGGMEHTTLHLLYSRFWTKFLFDIGVCPVNEPYAKRTSHGMILAKDGQKMSKSRGNVINPDDMVKRYGADAFRTYEMFMGPFTEAISWNTEGLIGVKRFLDRIWRLFGKMTDGKQQMTTELKLNQTIKKVTEDIESMHFNTAVSTMMEYLNLAEKEGMTSKHWESFVKILYPFAPHICEELWAQLGHKESITYEPWPKYDKSKIRSQKVTIGVQIMGKVRGSIEPSPNASEKEAIKLARFEPNISKYLEGKKITRVIYVPGKILNFIVR